MGIQTEVQFYSGNHLNGTHAEKTGFCLKTQHYPDSPIQLYFPFAVLQPDEKYITRITYKFSFRKIISRDPQFYGIH